VYDPPLKWDEKISGLGRNVGIPARVDGVTTYSLNGLTGKK
jgi:hypothetical protein